MGRRIQFVGTAGQMVAVMVAALGLIGGCNRQPNEAAAPSTNDTAGAVSDPVATATPQSSSEFGLFPGKPISPGSSYVGSAAARPGYGSATVYTGSSGGYRPPRYGSGTVFPPGGAAAGTPNAGWTGYPPHPSNAAMGGSPNAAAMQQRLDAMEARATEIEKQVEQLFPLVQKAIQAP